MNMVFNVVSNEDLGLLIASVKEAAPRDSVDQQALIFHVIGIVQNLQQGKSPATKIFTDTWPHFSAVVCHLLEPKIAFVANVYCYATSDSALVNVLKESGVLHCGLQRIAVAEHHTNYLLQAFPDRKVIDEGIQFYLPDIECQKLTQVYHGPSGFTIGKLSTSQDQVEFVASYWDYIENGPEKTSDFRSFIANGHSCALYDESGASDINKPVAWCLQYHTGEIGHVYSLPGYRRMGLARIAIREICKLIIADGMTPAAVVSSCNLASRDLFLKLGFLASDSVYHYNLIVSQ